MVRNNEDVATKGNGKRKQAIPKKNTNGKGKEGQPLPQFMTGGQLAGMYTHKEMPSALNMLAHPGDSPRQLGMRTILGKKTEGRILGVALAYHLGRLEEFGDVKGKEEILDMEALWVSDLGIGRTQLTNAITGERNHEEAKAGLGGWLQKMAWGDKDKNKNV